MSKFFSALFIIGSVLSGVQVASAQSPAPQSPNIYVTGLYVQESKVREGAVVQGAFRLENKDGVTYSGLKYSLLLSRYIDIGIPGETLDDKTFGPITLGPKESKLVSFSYTLPKGVAGDDLGIRIRVVTDSGLKLAWDDEQFQVVGEKIASLSVSDSSVIVNGEKYDVEEGPTAYPSDTASYVATISNPGNAAVNLIPTVSLYKKDLSGKFVTKTTVPAVKIGAKSQGQFIFTLPLNLDPEIYVGKVTFADEKGVARVSLASFRYIIGGDIVTIQNMKSDVVSAASGQLVTLTIDYTGSPVDIGSTTAQRQVGSAILAVKLYNEKNEVIGTARETSEFQYSGSKTIAIKTSASAAALRAVVTVSKDGRTIGSSNAVLSLSESGAEKTHVSLTDTLMIVFGFGIAVVLFVLWKLRKNHMPPPQVMPLAGLILLITAVGFLALPSKTFAFTTNGPSTASFNLNSTIFGEEGNKNVDWRPMVVLKLTTETRGSQNTLGLGEKFYIDLDTTIPACQNKPSMVGYQVKYLDGGTWKNMGTTTRSTGTGKDHPYTYNDTIRCGDGTGAKCVTTSSGSAYGGMYVAPTTPGTYRIYMMVFNDPLINLQLYPNRGSAAFVHAYTDADKWPDNEVNFGWVMGYQEFTVVDLNPKGDVQIESITNDTSASFDDHRPKLLSRYWNNVGGTAVYLSSPLTTSLFKELPAGGGYTTSLDANYPEGKTGPTYTPVEISRGTVGNMFAAVSLNFKTIFSFLSRPAFAAGPIGTPASCNRAIPENPTNIEVGKCFYARGGAECSPTLFEPLSVRGLPSDTECKADLYYAPGGFEVKGGMVTKIVYKFGQTPFDFSVSAAPLTLAKGETVINPVTVTKDASTSKVEAVVLSVISVSTPDITAEWVDDPSCTPNSTCSEDLRVIAKASISPGIYTVSLQGTSVSGVVRTANFQVTIPSLGNLKASCKATVKIPNGGVEDPATQAGVNQDVTWSAIVDDGVGPYTYTWTGTDLPATGIVTDSNSFIKRYGQLGRKKVTLVVTDKNGVSSTPQECSAKGVLVKVNPIWREN